MISVIIPNYNHAPYLKQRIDSVLNQTYQDFEVILLDDCSLDSSKEIIEAYRNHPKVSYIIYNQHNSGSPFKQWNRGVRLAKGEYIWIAESDDYSESNFLAALIPALDLYHSAALVYCLSKDINETGQEVTETGWWMKDLDPIKWTKDHYQNGKQACERYFIHKNIVPNASAVVFRKSVFDEIGGAPEYMTMCGDWWVWIKMLIKNDYFYSAAGLNYQRTHTNTTRNVNSIDKKLKKIKEELSIYYLLEKHFESSLAENTREEDLYRLWIQLQERKKTFSSFYKLPSYTYPLALKYLSLAFYFNVERIYAFFKRSIHNYQ